MFVGLKLCRHHYVCPVQMFVSCSCVLSKCFLFVIVLSQTYVSCINVNGSYIVCNICVPCKCL